jgi:hypothetical protein
VSADELPARLADWLSGNLLAASYLLLATGAPGLSEAEADRLVIEDMITSDLDAVRRRGLRGAGRRGPIR